MLDPDLYYMAYESIKGNKGALTPGVEGDTLDSFSKEMIEKIIKAIKDHSYKFSPIRRCTYRRRTENSDLWEFQDPRIKLYRRSWRLS